MSALLFGSISTVIDTSELQRTAFNQAFDEHGLGWHWDREPYRAMLDVAGGTNRIAEYAKETGDTVDASAVHSTKSSIFRRLLAESDVTPREGVVETITAARDQGWKVGFVTTTSADNVAAITEALAKVAPVEFDVVVDVSQVDNPKPDPEAYQLALAKLGESAADAVAIEDNVEGYAAAVAAGVQAVAFPNANTAGHDFGADATPVSRLSFDEIASRLAIG